jgi:hypothetical protein
MCLPLKHNRYITGIAALLAAGIVLATAVGSNSASAKGGGMSANPPRPFTREELILIQKCRFLARSRGMDSPVFARECATVRPYLNHWAWPPCICSVSKGGDCAVDGACGQVVAMPRPGQCWKLRPVFQFLLSSAAAAGDKREKNLTARMHDAANNIRTTI